SASGATDKHTLIVLDPAVRMSDVLFEGVDEAAVLRLGDGDPLEQILAALRERPAVQSLHVVSHGVAGNITLAGHEFNTDNLAANARALHEIGALLGENADLLLYACDVA